MPSEERTCRYCGLGSLCSPEGFVSSVVCHRFPKEVVSEYIVRVVYKKLDESCEGWQPMEKVK